MRGAEPGADEYGADVVVAGAAERDAGEQGAGVE